MESTCPLSGMSCMLCTNLINPLIETLHTQFREPVARLSTCKHRTQAGRRTQRRSRDILLDVAHSYREQPQTTLRLWPPATCPRGYRLLAPGDGEADRPASPSQGHHHGHAWHWERSGRRRARARVGGPCARRLGCLPASALWRRREGVGREGERTRPPACARLPV